MDENVRDEDFEVDSPLEEGYTMLSWERGALIFAALAIAIVIVILTHPELFSFIFR